jgi:hypothetical protein
MDHPILRLALTLFLIWLPFLYAIPIVMIVGRLGYSKWWAVLFLVPPLNLLPLWALAYMKWPPLKSAKLKQTQWEPGSEHALS